MSRLFMFADEAGDFTFSRDSNVSRYFILCSVTMQSLGVGDALRRLRHELVWEKVDGLQDYFHATSDSQAIRDRVYTAIVKHPFKVQATICEKAKAQPQVRASKARFYKYPWYYHFKHGIAPHVMEDDQLLVTAASIGNKKERVTFCKELDDVMAQHLPPECWAVDFRPCQTDPCLQVADYCAWAIQRKWERKDSRSYSLIADRITNEFDLWQHGNKQYY